MTLSYQQEPWFALLLSRTEGTQRSQVAKQLGISPATLSQVLNGSGLYGTGQASTERIADKVTHTFGRYTCPHLTEEAAGEPQVVTAEQCRGHACQCPHKAASAPPVPRAIHPRNKVIPIQQEAL